MKTEHFEYIKSKKQDPAPSAEKQCHKKNITSMIVLYPEQLMGEQQTQQSYPPGTQEYKNHIKFVTGSADGKVKIWPYGKNECEQTIEVSSKYMVLAMSFMTKSKRLVAASADRQISFYEITNGQKFSTKTISKIENLLAVPLCLEYHPWTTSSFIDDDQFTEPTGGDKESKGPVSRQKVETLLVGDDLGIITKYDFTAVDWHHCHYDPKDPLYCCNKEIEAEY